MLVPNQRRLDLLLADYMRSEADGAVRVHPPAHVLSQWVEETCVRVSMLRGEAVGQHADASRLQLLWQQAMPVSSGLSPESEKRLAAKLARTADKWLRQWYRGDASPWLDPAFFSARQKVREQLMQLGLWDAEDWTEKLIELLSNSSSLEIKLPQKIELDGFHELTRLENELLATLESRGVHIQPITRPICQGQLRLFACDDASTELATAAHWARDQVQSGSQKIVVVVNGLENQATDVRRTFENVFYPRQRLQHERADDEAAFCMPCGEPLLNSPVVEHALMLLQLSVGGPRRPIPFSRLSNWLLSPFWAGADTERVARSQLELKLRRDGLFQLLPASLQEWAAKKGLEEALPLAIDHSRAALSPQWQQEDVFYHCLDDWGWPGPLATGHDNQGAIRKFVSLLEKLRQLPAESPAERLTILRQACTTTRIAGQGGPLSPVQILSPDDAAGQRYDAAWVANLADSNWPGSPVHNPYLPSDASKHIPRAGHEGELGWTIRLHDALRQLAPEVIFSWGQQSGDLVLGPSPLLGDIPVTETTESSSSELHRMLFVDSSQETSGSKSTSLVTWRNYGEHPWLKSRQDHHGRALQAANAELSAEAISGGASAINDQSALPLLAYLKYRLGARFDPMPDAFADAAYRGTLLHSALQRLYQPFVGTNSLPGVEAVPVAVENALREKNAFQRLSLLQYEAERSRLVRVLEEWLEKDSARPILKISALEQPLETQLCGHPVNLRADRIDQLPDGSYLIIDYKSSKRATSAWARNRLGEVQVPLYARLLDRGDPEGMTVGGIALATVRHGECLLDGVVQDASNSFDKLKDLSGRSSNLQKRFEDWAAAFAYWQQSIDELALEFIGGECGNVLYDPSHPGLDEYQILLRHNEGEAWNLQTDLVNGPAAPSVREGES